MLSWNGNIDPSCVFCHDPIETRRHLFFECAFSAQIWEVMMRGVLCDSFTTEWDELMRLVSNTNQSRTKLFVIRYMFQSVIHTIWRERNRRRHGEASSPAALLIKLLDKIMRNKFTVMRRKGRSDYEGGMVFWFAARQSSINGV